MSSVQLGCGPDQRDRRRSCGIGLGQLSAALSLWLISGTLMQAEAEVATKTANSHATPTLSVHSIENFYDVSRWSARDLLIPAAPGEPLGHPAAGLTRTELSLRKQLLELPQGCRAVELAIIIQIRITMPRWSGLAERKPEDMEAALAHLRAHEHVHRDDAVAAGAKLQQTLQRLPLDLSCARLERVIDLQLQRRIVHLRMRGDVFDQLTDYGRRGLPGASPRRSPPRTPPRPSAPLF